MRKTHTHLFLTALLFTAGLFSAKAQLIVDIHPTEAEIIQQLLKADESVKINNITFGGAHEARGVFYSKNTPLPIDSGFLLTTGFALGARGANNVQDFTGSNKMKGDKDIHFLAGYKTYDAAYIQFDFTTTQSIIKFDYVFASEEYPEYAGSPFNDMFAFLLTDLESGEAQNLAVIPNTTIPIMVNTLNHRTYADFYIDNSMEIKSGYGIQYDGLTQPLIAYANVTPGKKYRIKIVIADVGDDALDSGVFIKAKSFESVPSADFYADNENYFESFQNQTMDTKSTATKTKKVLIDTISVETDSKSKATGIPDSIIVYFDFDQSAPIPKSLAAALKKIQPIDAQTHQLILIGHTDQIGSMAYNQNLSKARTQNIAQSILEIAQYNMSTSWESYRQLAIKKLDSKSRSKNRRVVIYISSK